MSLLVDAHFHLYSEFAPARALALLGARLASLAPDSYRAAVLTDRSDARFYDDIQEGRIDLESFRVRPIADGAGEALHLRGGGVPDFFLYPGRQAATCERLEALSLGADQPIPDGLTIEETLARIEAAGGAPALSWAPGKWTFARGKRIAGLIESLPASRMLIGDTSLRPAAWPVPRLFRQAEQRGWGIVAGSDPLPVAGEEKWGGIYASHLPGHFDPLRPAQSLQTLLVERPGLANGAGRRCSVVETAGRLWRNLRRAKDEN